MKKLAIIIASTIISINTFAQKANYKVFPFKTGIIEYKQEGNAKGTHVKYIDEYGYKQADYTETETTVFGFTNKENNGVILVGSKAYSINYATNTASTTVNTVYSSYANSDGTNYDELGRESMASLGFSNTGETENIVGKKCEIWEGSLGKIWIWKSLALKSQTTILGINITETATKITIDSNVPSNKFEVPENIEIEEIQMVDESIMNSENLSYPNNGVDLSEEDKDYINKTNKMSYSEFKQMVLNEDLEMSEDEIKLAYKMSKEMAKYVK